MRTIVLLFFATALSGIAIPMPEDVALLAAGATLEEPAMFVGSVLAAVVGLLCRDSFFFLLGHFAGEGVFKWRLVRRFIGEERIVRGRQLVETKGGRAVLIARFMVGVRATGFLASGALGVRIRDFFFWDTVGLLVSVPLMLTLGYALGEPIMAGMNWVLAHKYIVLAVGIVGVLVWGARNWTQTQSAPSGPES